MPTPLPRRQTTAFIASLACAVSALNAPPASAATITLKSSGGSAWTGTANTCTYASVSTDSAGNIAATCQSVSSTPTPPIANNVGSRALTVGTSFNLSLADYVTRTDGDVPSGYTLTAGTLPAGLAFNGTTGVISGTPTAEGAANLSWTATDKDGTSNVATASLTVTAAGGGTPGCAPTPGTFSTEDWESYTNSTSVMVRSLGAGNGIAIRFSPNATSYPKGVIVSDSGTGAKTYSISSCPGDMANPAGGQTGSTDINSDTFIDNCATLPYIRYPGYVQTSSSQTTCWLTPGSTYYLNIRNESGTAGADIQLKNGKLLR